MTERTTILIVDDESKIRRLLSRSLEAEGFDVAVADSAMSASEYLKNGHCDLIILDYMMPEIDGMAFLAELRKKSSIPVIMLSAREEIAKKTQALELGADDYLPKPFHLAELSARIRSVLRRHQRDGHESLDAGNVRLWPDSRRVEVAGREVELLRKEYDILYYFMSRPNHMVDKATLAEAVWGDHIDQADNFDFVYAQMKNLRRRLHDAQADIEIRAVYGFGYKLVAP